MKTHYFVDFDNTISNKDVWDTLVRTFAPQGWRNVTKAYIKGKISSREGNLRVAEFFPSCEDAATKLVRQIGIDPSFVKFAQWAEMQSSPLTILSDGYDFYIEILLREAGLAHLTYFSNHLKFTDSGIQVEFPLQNDECVRDMAHCKCQHLVNSKKYRRVYIGDGISDFCAAKKCEQIYAKLDLLDYCKKEEIEHIAFENFDEVIKHEQSLLDKKIETIN